MTAIVEVHITTTKEVRVSLTGRQILDVLRTIHMIKDTPTGSFTSILGIPIPPPGVDVELYVDVPGGGDWSNTRLAIDEKTPLVLTWKETVYG